MISASKLDLAEFSKAVLRSERIRTLCMSVVFGAFLLLGIFRVIAPLGGKLTVGAIILGFAVVYFAFEMVMLRQVNAALKLGRPLSHTLARAQLVLECFFPLGLMGVVMLLDQSLRYTVIVSPGYAFMLLLIGVSVLRVDKAATLLTGTVCFVGYTALVIWTLASPATIVPSPHPSGMYFNLAVVLALATGATYFVAGQVQAYVEAAVREMQTRREHDRLKHDLEIAGEIQAGLLPPSMPQLEQYEFAAVCKPADQAGGDYFDWQEIGSQRVVFSLGDVTGHGVGPALVTAACRAYVRATMGEQISAVSLLGKVNDLLNKDIPEGKFVTLVLVDLDVESHQFRLLSAGHGPTLVIRGQDGVIKDVDSQGMPLGLFADQTMDEPIQGNLAPGDLIIAVSDGFFEWPNESGELFGVERLQDVIRENRHRSAAEILDAMEQAVKKFVGDLPQQDDVTGVIIKRVSG